MIYAGQILLDEVSAALSLVTSLSGGVVALYEDQLKPVVEENFPAYVVEPNREAIEAYAKPLAATVEWTNKKRFSMHVVAFTETIPERGHLLASAEKQIALAALSGISRQLTDVEYSVLVDESSGSFVAYGAQQTWDIDYLTPNTRPDELIVRNQ